MLRGLRLDFQDEQLIEEVGIGNIPLGGLIEERRHDIISIASGCIRGAPGFARLRFDCQPDCQPFLLLPAGF